MLERKLMKRRLRLQRLVQNPEYEEFILEPENSKAFGFPDNSKVSDPDASILNASSSQNLLNRSEDQMSAKGISAHEGGYKSNYGLKDGGKVSSNLAVDKYQSMMALGTSTGIIKIFNLKGYELEIYDAHDFEINHLAFVPNRGQLVSIDVTNMLKLWEMEDLTDCEV